MLTSLVLILIAIIYWWIKNSFSYWSRRGVPHKKPSFPFGNLEGFGKKPIFSMLSEVYNRFKVAEKKFVGMYYFLKPVVLVHDLDFAKDVLVKDFQHFHDRGFYQNEKGGDLVSSNLLALVGDRWRNARNILTPTFTAGKIKLMFPLMAEIGEKLSTQMIKETGEGAKLDMRDICARFTTDMIGSCAFGLECNCLQDPGCIFQEMGRRTTAPTLMYVFTNSFPKLSRFFNIKMIEKEVEMFFLDTIKSTIKYRKQNKIQREDFLDTLIKHGVKEVSDGDKCMGWQIREIVSHSLIFFIAGYENATVIMALCLYELALNQEIQDKARENIRQILAKHGSVSYDALLKMKYLENCINETLRKHPPLPLTAREVTKSYHIPDMDVTLEEGTRVLIPIHAIQNDPQYYADPERFDPDRFDPEKMVTWHPLQFIPFGYGPRNCIGFRFGMMQMILGLANMLDRFRFTVSDRTPVPLEFDSTKYIVTSFVGPMWLNVENVQK
ncbi:probable cytochrome P450 6a14 [Uranotaenia lowii]|uniref:probable cytochrome P450 6a14 n=1 Tax=Uranotaenia lowii TaxID=190385 RepID=UPI002479C616|nr:probable cytochrome P450 6a14 [Uranotaenia lowii]